MLVMGKLASFAKVRDMIWGNGEMLQPRESLERKQLECFELFGHRGVGWLEGLGHLETNTLDSHEP